MACVCTSAALRVKFGGGVATRHFPITVGDGPRRFSFNVGRNAAKIAAYCIVIKSGASSRFTLFVNVAPGISNARRFRWAEASLGVQVILVIPRLFGGPRQDDVVIVGDTVGQEVATGHPRAGPRNKVNIEVRIAINVRPTGDHVGRPFVLFCILQDLRSNLIRVVVERRRVGTREGN